MKANLSWRIFFYFFLDYMLRQIWSKFRIKTTTFINVHELLELFWFRIFEIVVRVQTNKTLLRIRLTKLLDITILTYRRHYKFTFEFQAWKQKTRNISIISSFFCNCFCCYCCCVLKDSSTSLMTRLIHRESPVEKVKYYLQKQAVDAI